MTYLQAYLLTRLDSFSNFLTIIFIASIIGFLGNVFIYIDEWEDEKKIKKAKYIKYFVISILASGFINCAVPSKKEAAFIYIAPAIVNNQDFQKTVKQLPELSNLGMQYLNDILKEKISDKDSKK